MSNPKFKPIFEGLMSSSDDLGYFEHFDLTEFEKGEWTPYEKETLALVRQKLRDAINAAGEALSMLDEDDEWGAQ